MIGEMVHYNMPGNIASSGIKQVCRPATILAEGTQGALDLLVFLPNVPAVTKLSVSKGGRTTTHTYHPLNHEDK